MIIFVPLIFRFASLVSLRPFICLVLLFLCVIWSRTWRDRKKVSDFIAKTSLNSSLGAFSRSSSCLRFSLRAFRLSHQSWVSCKRENIIIQALLWTLQNKTIFDSGGKYEKQSHVRRGEKKGQLFTFSVFLLEEKASTKWISNDELSWFRHISRGNCHLPV